MKTTIENMENLVNMLYGEKIVKEMQLKQHTEDIDLTDRKEIDREDEVARLVANISELSPSDVLDKAEEIENNIRGLIGFDPKYLTMEELMEVDEMVYEVDKFSNYHRIAQKVSDELEQEKSLYCWNCELEKYESLIFDEEDYDRLKNLNIIKKLYEKDGWIYKLYYLDGDLRLKPLDNYLLENEDYTMVCVCRDGNILNLKRDNWILVKHPLLRKEYLEEIESAKKVGQWLEENGYHNPEKIEQEVMQEAEVKAKEIEELLEVAEKIIGEENIDNGDE